MNNEAFRISKLQNNLYNGTPWIDVTIQPTLQSLNTEKAAKKLRSDVNSIWEITNHMISWRKAVLKRMNGEAFVTPDNNFFEPVSDTSETAWQQTLKQFEETQHVWTSFLQNLTDEALDSFHDKKSPMTRYEIIHGIIQHDAYHLGQIKLLARILQ